MSDSQNPASPTPPAPAPPPPPSSPPPGGSAGGPGGGGPRLPWVERQQRGFVEAFVETSRLIVQNPRDAFGRIRSDGDYVSPLLFGGIFWLVAILVQLFLGQIVRAVFGSYSGLAQAMGVAGIGVVMSVVVLIIAPFILVIVFFLLAGIFHGILSLLGALTNSPNDFNGTFKVVGYAALASILGVIPIIGGLLSLVALAYLCWIGLQRAHGCSAQHSAIALSPLALCGLCGAIGLLIQALGALF